VNTGFNPANRDRQDQRWSEVKARVAVLRMSFDASRASMHTALLDARRSGSSRVSGETSCTYARWRNGLGMQMPLEGRHWYARIHAYVTCNVACHVNAQGMLRSLCVISPRRNFPGWLECREGKLLSKIYAGSDLFWPDFSILMAEVVFLMKRIARIFAGFSLW